MYKCESVDQHDCKHRRRDYDFKMMNMLMLIYWVQMWECELLKVVLKKEKERGDC